MTSQPAGGPGDPAPGTTARHVSGDAAGDAADLETLKAQMLRLADRRFSDNTKRSYASAWRGFDQWCQTHGRCPLPADSETAALYATWLASLQRSPNTITTHLAAILAKHRNEHQDAPDLYDAHLIARSHRRERSDAGWSERQMDGLRVPHLRQIRDAIDFSVPIGVRDWAIIMLGFAIGGRRSELACLDITDVRLDPPHWLLVRLCHSKTDQAGVGKIVQIKRGQDHALCPVAAVLDWVGWLRMRGITEGPLFRSMQGWGTKLTIDGRATTPEARSGRLTGQGCSNVIKRNAERAGVDLDKLGGHSVRRGGATSAYEAGADANEIADHFRWKRGSQAMQRYLDAVDARRRNAMAKVL